MKTFKAYIFDLDGTIVDTEPVAAQVVRECFMEWKLPITVEDSNRVMGRKMSLAFEELAKIYKIPVEIDEALRIVGVRYRRVLEKEVRVIPGVVEFIGDLAKQGAPLALVSGSTREEVVFCLEQAGVLPHFSVVLGAQDYPQSKPAPDGFLKAAQMMGVEPREVLVFEDSVAGVASARTAGMSVMGITAAHHFPQDLSHADHQVKDFSGMKASDLPRLFS